MGCCGSKQNNVEVEKKNRKRNSEKSLESVKTTASKTNRQKLNGTARVVDIDSDVKTGWNDENVPVQRSITPPPRPTNPPPSAPSSKRSSKTVRSKWSDEELLCQLQRLDPETSSNIVRMFDEGNTIPFMCRYRREMIGNLSADE